RWDPDAAKRLLGHLPEPQECDRILTRLGLSEVSGERLVPPWRFDITRNEDLAEEIARITGYDAFEPTLPEAPVVARIDDGFYGIRSRIMDTLVAAGLLQGVHYSFGPAVDGAVALANPLGEQTAALRTELWPGLCIAAAHNQRHGEPDVRLFEIGRIFRANDNDIDERWHLGLILTGRRVPEHWAENRSVDLFDARGILESVLADLGIDPATLECRPAQTRDELHPGKSAELLLGGVTCGWLGELEPESASKLELQTPVVGAEVDLHVLLGASEARETPKYTALPRFPGSHRDLAFVLKRTTASAAVRNTIIASGGDLLESVHVFDVYEGKGLADDERSVAFRLRFRAPDRTLAQEEVDAVIAQVIAAVQDQFGARLR
ncbi:MAG: phenylalanine--tRNA ligase subunit beta, partial [Candidatus Dadabacteria bacterium]